MRKNTLLVMPAYNEELNIEKTLSDLLDAGVDARMDILVINDGSTDGTLRICRKYEPRVRVIDQIYNMGYGAALQTGYKYAVLHDYEYLVQMDADGQHDRKNLDVILDRLTGRAESSGLKPLEKALVESERIPDIIIGSRFLEGGQSFKISGLKQFAIGFFSGLIRAFTGYRLTDPTSGLQGLNRKAFSYYSRYTNFDLHYPDLNMIAQMLFLGYHVEEVPAIMHERTAGVSMHAGIWKPIKYMVVMMVSTFNAFTRHYRVFDRKKKAAAKH